MKHFHITIFDKSLTNITILIADTTKYSNILKK